MTTTTRWVPTGGYGRGDGRIFTRSEVTAAVQKYARKYGFYARTVRSNTVLMRAAMAAAQGGTPNGR